MKILNGQVCCQILLYLLLLAGCSLPVQTTDTGGGQQTPEVGDVESTGILTVSHFSDENIGFKIHEPLSAIDDENIVKFQHGVSALKNENFSAAIELFLDVINSCPNYSNPHINIAFAYRHLGMNKEAQAHLLTALDLVPNHPVASNEYALMVKNRGNFHKARNIYEQALTDYPEYIPLHRNLGILCDVYLNDRLCAQEQFEYCQELSGDSDDEIALWLTELKRRPQK